MPVKGFEKTVIQLYDHEGKELTTVARIRADDLPRPIKVYTFEKQVCAAFWNEEQDGEQHGSI